MRTFQFTEGTSNKFWNVELQGSSYVVTFGRIGTAGQTQKKDFPNDEAAKKAYEKIIAEKVGKGYAETTPKGASSAAPAKAAAVITPLQQSLEQALVENPDDLAAHSAYADYLSEQGDPRGELIQLQLALEDPKRPPAERKKLQQRETAALKKNAGALLGELAKVLVGDWSGEDKPWHYRVSRGWLDVVRMLPFPEAAIELLARSPEARLVRRLEIVYDMRYHPFDFNQVLAGPCEALGADADSEEEETYEPMTIMPPILKSPHLTNLRVFKLGFSDDEPLRHSTMVDPFGDCSAKQIVELLHKCPHLEELYLNTSLAGIDKLFSSAELAQVRVLQYYFGAYTYRSKADSIYPLSKLAKNTNLNNLTTLRLHPGRDATIDLKELQALLRSPNLPKLTHLQVHMTNFGDDGARSIASSGIVKRLKVLDVAYGNMTDDGARMLADCEGIRKLDRLDVSRNALTKDGIAALKASGVRFVADEQHDAEENDYLGEVDVE
jgi:uncharacterized protein (TIGR02996 family)